MKDRILIRNKVNWICCSLIAYGLTAFLIGFGDFLGVRKPLEGGNFIGMDAVQYGAYFYLIAIVPYATLGRAHLELRGTQVTVVNPVRTMRFDARSIDEVIVGGNFASIVVLGRRIRAWGLELSLSQHMTGRGPANGLESLLANHSGELTRPEDVPESAAVPQALPRFLEVSFTKPDFVMISVTAIWFGYFFAAWVQRH